MRNAVRKLRASESSSEAEEMLPKVVSMVDRVAKRQIHANKAGNIKSKLAKKEASCVNPVFTLSNQVFQSLAIIEQFLQAYCTSDKRPISVSFLSRKSQTIPSSRSAL